jgi:hypothetical protein
VSGSSQKKKIKMEGEMAERGMTESGSEMAGLWGEKQRKRGTFVLWFSFGQGKGGVLPAECERVRFRVFCFSFPPKCSPLSRE